MSPSDHDPLENVADDDIHPLAKPFLFLSDPGFVKNFMWIVLVLWVISIALGFVIFGNNDSGKSHGPFDNAWAYWLVGFFGFSFAVLCGWPLRKLLMRDENYYGDDDDA